jgi:hypothetical protein
MNLKTDAVSVELLNALRALQAEPALSGFFLVGGTSLALRFGHRKSVDIDLFTAQDFDSFALGDLLARRQGFSDITISFNTVRGMAGGIKVDLIAHVYPVLAPLENIEGIRMAALPDIAAMKVNAISNRGSKKDFWDYALLLDHFRHKEMLDLFACKYAAFNRWHVEKSFMYFQDAEAEPDPVDLLGISWPDVKRKIIKMCS